MCCPSSSPHNLSWVASTRTAPVKSVFRFKLVCRDWLQYVMCPLFAQTYQSHNGPSTLAGFLQTHYGDLTRPFRNLHSLTHRIVASSDGRVLLVDSHNSSELLCDSITGELFEIPEFPQWAHDTTPHRRLYDHLLKFVLHPIYYVQDFHNRD